MLLMLESCERPTLRYVEQQKHYGEIPIVMNGPPHWLRRTAACLQLPYCRDCECYLLALLKR